MSRIDCISNRNIRVIFKYVESLLGDDVLYDLYKDMPFPEDRYKTAKDYFTNEDEWTTYEIFQRIFRNAKDLVGDPLYVAYHVPVISSVILTFIPTAVLPHQGYNPGAGLGILFNFLQAPMMALSDFRFLTKILMIPKT